MNFSEVVAELKRFGKEELRDKYRSHGAGDNCFGVSPANLNKLKKKIGVDHPLALTLWNYKNVDGQILAAMIADPPGMSEQQLDVWARDIDYYLVGEAFVSHVVSKTLFAKALMTKWILSKEEYIKQCGYLVMAALALEDPAIPDGEFTDQLYAMAHELQNAPSRAREAMIHAVIAIGKRNRKLNTEALIACSQIGSVYIDDGGTSRKLPSAMEILGDKKLREQLK
jgi:hypothetical protein